MTPKQTKEFLKYALLCGDNVIINGLHGIGKSSIVKQTAKENDLHYELLTLSIKEPSDLLGMPSSKETEFSRKTVWDEPDWFQRITNAAFPEKVKVKDLVFKDDNFKDYFFSKIKDERVTRNIINSIYKEYYELLEDELFLVKEDSTVSYSKAKQSLLFLDELNRAVLETRQVSLQLVLEKELHSHKLPYVNERQTFIVAAINPPEKYQVFELDEALMDRFTSITMEVSAETFIEYAKEVNLDQRVIDFISEFPDRLHVMYDDGSRGSTPRSWEQTSKYLKTGTNNQNILLAVFQGRLGDAIGYQFLQYVNEYNKNLNLEQIENLVQLNKDHAFEQICEIVKELLLDIEILRKKELFRQAIEKYKEDLINKTISNNIVVLILTYALEVEISYSVLKEIKSSKETEQMYYGIVFLDTTINAKKFFLNIAKFALSQK